MNTLIVSSKDFRQNFPKYQKLVASGVSITIVKRSKPIFKLEPVDLEFQENIVDALLDYENAKEEKFVDYAAVFKK
jgi:antitoxin (DNA-binding transcriptional repressor) of toxin-antitoxin stability system